MNFKYKYTHFVFLLLLSFLFASCSNSQGIQDIEKTNYNDNSLEEKSSVPVVSNDEVDVIKEEVIEGDLDSNSSVLAVNSTLSDSLLYNESSINFSNDEIVTIQNYQNSIYYNKNRSYDGYNFINGTLFDMEGKIVMKWSKYKNTGTIKNGF